jgi:hypothetical protein
LFQEDVLRKLDENTDGLRVLVEGLRMQAASLGHIAEMTAAILAAVAEREEPAESPLLDLLRELVGMSGRHSRSLDRIEDRLTRLEKVLHRA